MDRVTETDVDLSKLSFEERMAYYREKYETKNLPVQPAKRGQKEKRGRRSGQASTTSVPVPNTNGETGEDKESPQGLLSRFFGLFKKESQ
jgi:hypothetical protein